MAIFYKVIVKQNIKYAGKRYAAGEEVTVAENDFEEFEEKDLIETYEEVAVDQENQHASKLPVYEKITEDKIREELDALGVDHAEAKDKKAAYALLETAVKDND